MKNEPPIIEMSTGAINYRFYVDEKRKRVSGVAKADFREGVRRASARVKCSANDEWDSMIGIAMCRLKLDNKLGTVYVGIPEYGLMKMGWETMKRIVSNFTARRD
ncbi:MAG: hypothetical protein JRJ78_15605 [Deltaproteobacteria bacterium]|nr:hypothetical protein [Deltaproteobacteria bacterium]